MWEMYLKFCSFQNRFAGVAQSVEQLICNQLVGGSNPFTSFMMVRFPSGQRGQTVNLLATPSEVRSLPSPGDAGVAQLVEHQPSKL